MEAVVPDKDKHKQHIWSVISNKKIWFFTLLVIFIIFFRYSHLLFFTWDQGRDAFKIASIAKGDLTLIGPTSGLQGFFLGPFWYYAGLPGYLLGFGNPFVISIWYSALALLSVPAFYLIIKQLFPDQKRSYDWFLFLMVTSAGLIKAATQIWNPLLSVPLLSWAIWALIQNRNTRWWLFVGFSLLGLLLQAEFAYGVFLVIGLWLGLKIYYHKAKLIDYLISALGVAWTLLPQFLFELKNNFLITRALFRSLVSNEGRVSLDFMLTRRPLQIIHILADQIFGGVQWFYQAWVALLLLLILVVGWKIKDLSSCLKQHWSLIYLIFFLPLIGYSAWTGNYGFLFSYYLTSHFIPLYLIVFQISQVIKKQEFNFDLSLISKAILIILTIINLRFVVGRIGATYHSGILQSISAINSAYEMAKKRGIQQPTLRIFVPSLKTEHYDYLTKWLAKKNQRPIASTVKDENDQYWYLLMEPDHEIPEKRFVPWYKEAIASGKLVTRQQIGVLTLEEWERIND